jgi:hypothetical protein
LPGFAQRSDFKRMLIIAAGLEVIKYLFLLFASPPETEFLSVLLVIFFYMDSLPQIMAVGEFGPSNIWSRIGLICIGIIWNLIPTYFISRLLPHKNKVNSLKATTP